MHLLMPLGVQLQNELLMYNIIKSYWENGNGKVNYE